MITSEANALRVEFESDSSVHKTGFAAVFFTGREQENRLQQYVLVCSGPATSGLEWSESDDKTIEAVDMLEADEAGSSCGRVLLDVVVTGPEHTKTYYWLSIIFSVNTYYVSHCFQPKLDWN